MTNDEIYGLFCAADYSKLKLLQVLADVAGIDVYELINIIEKKENGIMAQHKWTDEENAEIMRLHGSGVKCWVIASKFGTSEANIRWRISMLRKKGVQGTTNNPDNTDTTLIGAIAQSEADKTNRQLAELRDTPDPTPAPEAALREELKALQAEHANLRAAYADLTQRLEERAPNQAHDLYDRLHNSISLLQDIADRQDMTLVEVTVAVYGARERVLATTEHGDSIEWNKNIQPAAGTADRKGENYEMD